MSIPMIKVFDSISAVEKLGEVVKSMTCVLYYCCLNTACSACLYSIGPFNSWLDKTLAIDLGAPYPI